MLKLSFEGLGGERTDQYPRTNPNTGFLADEVCDSFCSVAMQSRTQNLAKVKILLQVDSVVQSYEAVWKANTPATPTVVRTGDGTFTISFPATVVDERGRSESLNLQFARASVMDGEMGHVKCNAVANEVYVSLFNSSLTPWDLSDVVVYLEVS